VPEADLLTVEWIDEIHDRVVSRYDLEHGGVRRRKADRFLQDIVEDAREIDDPHEKAAHFMRRLKNVHVYEDGNKRTGWLAATYILNEYGYQPVPGDTEADTIMRHIRRFE
jgi:prophage maintenance system killer protein